TRCPRSCGPVSSVLKPVLRQNLIQLSGRRPGCSRGRPKNVGEDCRQEGRPAVRVRRGATQGWRALGGGSGERPEARARPSVANRPSWVGPPGGQNDG